MNKLCGMNDVFSISSMVLGNASSFFEPEKQVRDQYGH